MDHPELLFSHVSMEPSSRCNLRCATCPNRVHRRPFAELPAAVFRDVIRELAELDYRGAFSPHFYNEPLTDLRIIPLMRLAKKALPSARMRMFSNFTLMTPETYRSLYPWVDSFIVTVDEPVIRKAVEALAAELPPDERNKILARSLNEVGLSNRAGLVDVRHEKMRRPHRCMFALDHVDIDASGDVHLCCNDYKSRAVFGNVKSQSLTDIWFSDEYKRMRAEFAAGGFPHSICKDCYWVYVDRCKQE